MPLSGNARGVHAACGAAVSVALLAAQVGALLRASPSPSTGGDASSLSAEPAPEPTPRPVMDVSEYMRAMLCWGHPQLIEHDKCMKWMIEHCEDRSTGHGTCQEIKENVRKECATAGVNQKLACEYKKLLEAGEDAPAAERTSPSPATPATPAPPQTLEEAKRAAQNGTAEARPMTGMSTRGGLPDQGFDGHSTEMVDHRDHETQTGDWGEEWPQTSESDGQTKERICEEYPRLLWCKLFVSERKQKKAKGQTDKYGIE